MTAGYLRCENRNCGWIGREIELLLAAHPFEPDETVRGCPKCHAIDSMLECCDEPECFEASTCGWTDSSGNRYRRTCGKHMTKQ